MKFVLLDTKIAIFEPPENNVLSVLKFKENGKIFAYAGKLIEY